MDVTDKTVSTQTLLNGYTALANDGTSITGELVQAPVETLQSLTVTPTNQQQIFHGEGTQLKNISLNIGDYTISPPLTTGIYYICRYLGYSNGGYVLAQEKWDKILLTDAGVTVKNGLDQNAYTLYPNKATGHRTELDAYKLQVYESVGSYFPVTINAAAGGIDGDNLAYGNVSNLN